MTQTTKSVEDFLKAVYTLQQSSERVSTNALAEALNIVAPSVTDMAKRLSESGLLDYKKYYGVQLTDEGHRIAINMVRRHRLIELYLVQELGYGLHEVHDEAEALEHAVSDRFVDAISHKMNQPEFDPHGDPIPNKDGTVIKRNLQSLAEVPLQSSVLISRFISDDNDVLQHMTERGFKLQAEASVLARDPFDGPVTVQIDGEAVIIGHNIAAMILVEIQLSE